MTLTFDLSTSNLFPQLLVSRVMSPQNMKFLRLSNSKQIIDMGQTDGHFIAPIQVFLRKSPASPVGHYTAQQQ